LLQIAHSERIDASFDCSIAKNAEARGCKVELLEESGGEEAGLKSATVRVHGPEAMAG